MSFLTWIALAALSRLSPQENTELINRSCGSPYLGHPAVHPVGRVPVSTGSVTELYQYPFAAKVHKYVGNEHNLCSGVMISRRHVLTAAHCVLSKEFEGKRLTAINPATMVEVSFHSNYKNAKGAPRFTPRSYKAARILPHPQYTGRHKLFDIGIIELAQDVNPSDASPICLAQERDPLRPVMTSVGFGRHDPRQPSEGVMRSINLTLDASLTLKQRGLIITQDRGNTLCQGDSGSPLFRIRNNAAYLLGISAGAENVTDDMPIRGSMTYKNRFVDVRTELPWICAITGVCAETTSNDRKIAEDKNKTAYAVGYTFGSNSRCWHPKILAQAYPTRGSNLRFGVECPPSWKGTICVDSSWHKSKLERGESLGK